MLPGLLEKHSMPSFDASVIVSFNKTFCRLKAFRNLCNNSTSNRRYKKELKKKCPHLSFTSGVRLIGRIL